MMGAKGGWRILAGLWVLSLVPRPTCGARAPNSPLDADFDVRAHAMCMEVDFSALDEPHATSPWDAPIPTFIHQIWFGPLSSVPQNHFAAWEAYAASFGYKYRLWTDADLPDLIDLGGPLLGARLETLRRWREFRGASDISRYLLLFHLGGIYVDADMPPPTLAARWVDLRAFVSLRGTVITTDGESVELGVGGVHALNGLLMSAPGAPVLTGLLGQLGPNIDCCLRAGESAAVMMTGPAALNLALNSPVTVIPMIFWELLGVPDRTWQ